MFRNWIQQADTATFLRFSEKSFGEFYAISSESGKGEFVIQRKEQEFPKFLGHFSLENYCEYDFFCVTANPLCKLTAFQATFS